MKKFILFIFFGAIFGVSYGAQNDSDNFERVFSVIASPNVFSSSVEQVQKKLDGLCSKSTLVGKEQYKHGNMVCINEVNVDAFTISGGKDVGFIHATFLRTNDCDFIKNTLIANFGKPSKVTSECTLDWNLKPLRKGGHQRYVGFEVNKEENKTYFSIGEDQGP